MAASSQNSKRNSGKGGGVGAGKTKPNNPRGNPQNLKPFQPGQSGNPGGRPKKKPITEAILEILASEQGTSKKTGAQILAQVLFREGIKGRVPAIIELIDRSEGKATTVVHLAGEGGGPILHESLAGKSIAELRLMAQAKIDKLGLGKAKE